MLNTETNENESPGQDYASERAELDWVLAHPEISRSNNLVRFLTFVCNRYFAGATEDIRESVIATEALGRKQSNFDSHADPIVRVTARTLRKKLDSIYSTDGQSRPLRIVLPLGRYVPGFIEQKLEPSFVENSPQAESSEQDIEGTVSVPPPSSPDVAPSPSLPEPARALAAKPAIKWWPRFWKIGLASVLFLAGYFLGQHRSQGTHMPLDGLKWGDPEWADEFDGVAQQIPDQGKWAYDVEPAGDGQDRHAYCSPHGENPRDCDPRHPNAFLDGMGHLVLRAQKNPNHVWTLARIVTRDLRNFQYGRIEARIKMPVGNGLWPSFVMVGSNKDAVGWPACGSIDIAENVSLAASSNGLGPTMIRSTLHGPRYSGSNGLWHDVRLPNGGRVDDGSFHTYGIIWSPGMVQFYVDDPTNVYMVHNLTDVPEGGAWAFDHPFYLTMSLGEGGDWAGPSDAATPNPADMLVDYVRVYKIPEIHAPSITWQPVQAKAGSSVASIVTLRTSTYAGRVQLACATDSPSVSCSLATPVLNFSETTAQEDALTLSTRSFSEKGRMTAPPGRYHLTITATTLSGDRSQVTMPFDVSGS